MLGLSSGARRHLGELRILVDPEYRNRGLGTATLHELATIANDNGLDLLIFEAVEEKEDAAIKAAQFVGFVQVGVLRSNARTRTATPRTW
jgi:L-amino acid N-acyltransferase YncA